MPCTRRAKTHARDGRRWASKNEREVAHSKVAFGRYVQDSACDTWELLADAVHLGGSAAIKKCGWPLPGQVKHEWAEKIGPLMDPERNISPSFGKLRDGLRRLVAEAA